MAYFSDISTIHTFYGAFDVLGSPYPLTDGNPAKKVEWKRWKASGPRHFQFPASLLLIFEVRSFLVVSRSIYSAFQAQEIYLGSLWNKRRRVE